MRPGNRAKRNAAGPRLRQAACRRVNPRMSSARKRSSMLPGWCIIGRRSTKHAPSQVAHKGVRAHAIGEHPGSSMVRLSCVLPLSTASLLQADPRVDSPRENEESVDDAGDQSRRQPGTNGWYSFAVCRYVPAIDCLRVRAVPPRSRRESLLVLPPQASELHGRGHHPVHCLIVLFARQLVGDTAIEGYAHTRCL